MEGNLPQVKRGKRLNLVKFDFLWISISLIHDFDDLCVSSNL